MRGRALLALVALGLAALGGAAGARADHSLAFQQGACERVCIPAIVQPRFTREAYLQSDDLVVGFVEGRDARAYPIQVLVWHEIVNDLVGGKPVAITYCPLCGSSIAYEREVQGRVLTLQTSGMLYRNDLVMLDDETRSLWPQLLGEAAEGPLHGTKLEVLPSTVATWAEWQAAHPGTKLLARPLCSDWPYAVSGCPSGGNTPARRYGEDPYGDYATSRRIGISGHVAEDIQGLHPKAMVVGVVLGSTAKAWEVATVAAERVLTDDVGGQPVVVTFKEGTVRVFHRDAQQRFAPLNASHMRDQLGNAWELATGRAEDGGRLEPVPTVTSFWFAWVDFHPDTLLYGAARVVRLEPSQPVPRDAVVVVTFSHPMERAGVERGLRVEPGRDVNLTWTDDRTLHVAPLAPWDAGVTYKLRFDGATSQEGLPLASREVTFRAAGGLPVIEGLGPVLWVGLLAAFGIAAVVLGKGVLRRS